MCTLGKNGGESLSIPAIGAKGQGIDRTSVALSTNLLHATVPVREIETTDFDPASELLNKQIRSHLTSLLWEEGKTYLSTAQTQRCVSLCQFLGPGVVL